MQSFWNRKPTPPPAPTSTASTDAVSAGKASSGAVPRPPSEMLLKQLEWKIVRRLDGFFFGDYTGVFYGPSLDLAEVREYQPGDEVRRIDWNVTARAGKLHTRQYREEREITVWLVMDTSASMNFGTRRVLKRQLALEFAGTAAAIATRHGDKVGAVVLGNDGVNMIAPRSGRIQALNIVSKLFNAHAAPSTNLTMALTRLEQTLKRRSFVFVVSDFLSQDLQQDPWQDSLARLGQRHDVVAVRCIDPAERELPNVGGVRFRDPASNEELWLDTSNRAVREQHAKLVETRERNIARAFRAARTDHLELVTSDDVFKPLLRFAQKRKNRR